MQFLKWKIKAIVAKDVFTRACKRKPSRGTRFWEGECEGKGGWIERWDFGIGVVDVQKTM